MHLEEKENISNRKLFGKCTDRMSAPAGKFPDEHSILVSILDKYLIQW